MDEESKLQRYKIVSFTLSKTEKVSTEFNKTIFKCVIKLVIAELDLNLHFESADMTQDYFAITEKIVENIFFR